MSDAPRTPDFDRALTDELRRRSAEVPHAAAGSRSTRGRVRTAAAAVGGIAALGAVVVVGVVVAPGRRDAPAGSTASTAPLAPSTPPVMRPLEGWEMRAARTWVRGADASNTTVMFVHNAARERWSVLRVAAGVGRGPGPRLVDPEWLLVGRDTSGKVTGPGPIGSCEARDPFPPGDRAVVCAVASTRYVDVGGEPPRPVGDTVLVGRVREPGGSLVNRTPAAPPDPGPEFASSGGYFMVVGRGLRADRIGVAGRGGTTLPISDDPWRMWELGQRISPQVRTRRLRRPRHRTPFPRRSSATSSASTTVSWASSPERPARSCGARRTAGAGWSTRCASASGGTGW